MTEQNEEIDKFTKLKLMVESNYEVLFNTALHGEIKKRNAFLMLNRVQRIDLSEEFIKKHRIVLNEYIDILKEEKGRHAFHTLKDLLLDNFFKVFAIVPIRQGINLENIHKIFRRKKILECFSDSVFETLVNVLGYRDYDGSIWKQDLNIKDIYPFIEKEMLEEVGLHFLPEKINKELKSLDVLSDNNLDKLIQNFSYKNNCFASLKKKTDRLITKNYLNLVEQIEDDEAFKVAFLKIWKNILVLKIDIKDSAIMERFFETANNENFVHFLNGLKSLRTDNIKELSYYQNQIILTNNKKGMEADIEEEDNVIYRKIIKMRKEQVSLIFKYPRIPECFDKYKNIYFGMLEESVGESKEEKKMNYGLVYESKEKIELSANDIIQVINEIYTSEIDVKEMNNTQNKIEMFNKLRRTLMLKNKLMIEQKNGNVKINNARKKI